jgi:flagellar hook-associated protein 3 FlgL
MAQIGRVSTSLLQKITMSDFSKVQSQMADLQGQVSSGNKASDFAGLTGQVEQFVGLEAKINKLGSYVDNNQEVLSRLQTTQQAVSNSIEIADQMQNLIVLQRNGTALQNPGSFIQQLKALRASFVTQINQNVNGVFLFSGTKTNTPPIKDPIPELAQDGVPDAGYYQGSNQDIISRPQDGYEVNYNVRADAEGFQKVFASIDMAIKAGENKDDKALTKAYDMITAGLDGLNTIQTSTNANITDLQDINDRHDASKTYFKGVAESISKTDVLSASTEIALDQTILTATFQVFSKISSLRLVDFLR